LVNAAIGGRINFNDIDGVSGTNLGTRVADAARLGHGIFRRPAIQGHSQDAGYGSLPDAAMSAEDVAVRNAVLLNGVLECAGNVVLPDDFRELLGTVFSGKNLVAHGREMR